MPKGFQIIVGIWPTDEDALRDDATPMAIGANRLTGSLEGLVTLCVEAAIKVDETETRGAEKKL